MPYSCDSDTFGISSSMAWIFNPTLPTPFFYVAIWHYPRYKRKGPWLGSPFSNIQLSGAAEGFLSAISLVKYRRNYIASGRVIEWTS